MMQSSPAATSRDKPRPVEPIQYYSVELTPLEDGRVSVGIGATFCEAIDDDGYELVNIDVASGRADSIDHALAMIREAVVSTMQH
jgi:hypothetical protein